MFVNNARAIAKGCLNAQYPDQYGHYREADYTMTKHHWWWKVRQSFPFKHISIMPYILSNKCLRLL